MELREVGDLIPWLAGAYALILACAAIAQAWEIFQGWRVSRLRRAANPLGGRGGDADGIE